ncbi:MAG TPA: fatty acid desaturase [Stellaceae bacterium]|nr:fatty acid desaturase [Stellaceae bacterium]
MKASAIAVSVECAGLRLQVHPHVHRPWRFLLKVLLALAILAAGGALTLSGDWRLAVAGIFIEGLVFAHMLELVHSCIHGTAFGARRADRIAGVLLGLPMLVSFSDYRSNHLEHHRTLGKSEKKDFFGYEFEGMTTWLSFARHLLMLGHYRNAAANMARAATRWNWRKIPAAAFDSRLEHLLMALWLLVPLAALLSGRAGPFLVLVLPCLVAIPCHVLIELPEHWRCPPVDDPLVHTRSISASRLATWFTNGNNYHLEHHLCPWLPNGALRGLHLKLRAHAVHYQSSYFRFYMEVFRSLRFRRQQSAAVAMHD